MAVSNTTRARAWITARVTGLTVPTLGAVVLVAGAANLVPARTALAVGAGIVSGWATVVLAHAALRTRRTRHGPAWHGVGLTTVAAAVTGAAAALPAAPGPPASSVAAALVVAAVGYALGMLLLPGAAAGGPVRVRRVFDGMGFGVSLGFAAWLMPPMANAPGAALAAAMGTAAGVAVVMVTARGAVAHRRTARLRGAGAGAVLIGLYGVTTMLAYGHSGRGIAVVGLLVVVGLALTARAGATTHPDASTGQPGEADPPFSGYLLLAVPAAVGVVAAVYHFIRFGEFDRTAIVLGLSMVSILTVRQLLAVSDIRRYARRLTAQEAHFRSLVSGSTDLTLVLDDRLNVRWQSPAGARLFGLADTQVVGRAFTDLIDPDEAPDVRAVLEAMLAGEQDAGPPALVSARLRDGYGMWRDTESTVSDQRAVPEVAALVVHVRDVGERKHLERTLHRLSHTDQLTGLENRRALMRHLVAHRRQPGQRGTLLVIDLHGLAEANDVHGREVGDAVLVEVGRRIRSLLGADDVPVRLGGDEFAVLTSDGAVLAYALATRLVTRLLEPCQLPGVIVELHASVGLAELAGAVDSEDVLRRADLARSRARQLGRDRVEWYDPDVEAQLQRRMGLEQEIIGAVDRGELDLVFQPVLSLRDNQPVGVEALLRWRHPQLGTILPAELLPIAEAVGASRSIGDWALRAACRRLALWSDADSRLWMSVNVAPRELLDPGFPERVTDAVAAYGLAPERLVVEVAETWIAEDVPAVVAALAALRRHGVRAALDDFGAGQASLSHLRRLPVDMLKLAGALVNTTSEPPVTPAVIDVVVSLGRRLGLEIVAKGVETEEQIERARSAGCLYGQGFALARPAPAERTEAYLDAHRASSA